MRISEQYPIFAGEHTVQKEQNKEPKNAENFFAGDLKGDLFENKLLAKKKEAQKKAMKIVGEAFAGDQAIDDDLQERRDKIAAWDKENQALQKQIKEINQCQETLMEEYGVTADSQEQTELELLRKEDRYRLGSGPALTREEQEQVAELKKRGLSEYQTRQREWDSEKKHFQTDLEENTRQITQEYAIIKGTRLERLKQDPMVKAQKEADAVLDAAGREVIGMLMDEVKETVDERQEEAQEKADRLEEKQEKMEQFIEAQKEKNDKTEELLDNMPMEEILHMAQFKSEVSGEIKNIISEMKLVAEDIKGAKVDESL